MEIQYLKNVVAALRLEGVNGYCVGFLITYFWRTSWRAAQEKRWRRQGNRDISLSDTD